MLEKIKSKIKTKIKRFMGFTDEVDELRRELEELRFDVGELKKKRISDRTTEKEEVTPAQVFNEYLGEADDE